MAKQQTEEELNLRRKARRRLIGAIALTLAAVVILPMVLDSEPKPTGQDIELRIPAPDKAGEFVSGVAVSEVVGASPFAVSAVEAASIPAAEPIAAASSVVQAKPDAVPGEQPAVASILKTDVPDKDQSAANKQPESKSTNKLGSGEGFVAQVGAYANADTPKREARKPKKNETSNIAMTAKSNPVI